MSSSEPYIDLLSYFRVPDWPNVFVLGCLARHGTLYSQQVRGINLVFALHEIGEVAPGKRVAVIGAGAAGLTAAVASARVGAHVTLIEQLHAPLPLQRSSGKRFLHPHIYDWPSPNADGEDANLPLLNWSADYANNVARQIEREWDSELATHANHLEPHWNVHDVGIRASATERSVSWNDDRGPRAASFDVIIVAIGFGREGQAC